MPTERPIAVLLRTSEYRGDHAADVEIAHELLPGETVDALCQRLDLERGDVIELRAVVRAEVAHAD
jgi:hypothetical protein